MRLKEGIVVDEVKTFGNLKFSGLRREVYERDEEGNSTGVLIKRTYDLKSEAQGRMIQVSLPPEAGAKDFVYDQPVKLVDVVIDSVADARGRNRAEASWYLNAADLVPETAGGAVTGGAKTAEQGKQPEKPQPEKKA